MLVTLVTQYKDSALEIYDNVFLDSKADIFLPRMQLKFFVVYFLVTTSVVLIILIEVAGYTHRNRDLPVRHSLQVTLIMAEKNP